MSLGECIGLYGDADIIERDPSIVALQDALYVPINNPISHMGLFDVGRRIVLTGAYFRGPTLEIPNQTTPFRYSSEEVDRYDDLVVYLGFLHQHFGHFLLSTFSRLWPYARSILNRSAKIAVHTDEPGVAQYFFARPWAKALFAGIGLTEENFITFERPTRCREVLIPAPAFEEGSYAHRVYADLCNMAGANLSATVKKGSNNPAYLSKQKLIGGVRNVVNEEDLLSRLSRHGVDIVFPETLPVAEQVALWRDKSAIASIVCSALHTSILSPGKRVVNLSDSNVLQSNYALVDRVNHTNATYLALDNDHLILSTQTTYGFQASYRLINPIGVADAILVEFDRAPFAPNVLLAGSR